MPTGRKERKKNRKAYSRYGDGACLFVDHPCHLRLRTTSDTAQETRQQGFLFRLESWASHQPRRGDRPLVPKHLAEQVQTLRRLMNPHALPTPSNPSKVGLIAGKKAADHFTPVQ
jgi:hypothetical protein